MNLLKNIGVLAGILVLAVSIPTIAVTATNSEGVNVCVDWETKQVKSEHPFSQDCRENSNEQPFQLDVSSARNPF